jgi:3-(3-hydroxy-phenyl)propionate hydroxylase
VRRLPFRGLSGRLVPQPWVTVDGKRQRLDDTLGTGSAIITRIAPDPGLTALASRLRAPLLQLAGPAGIGSITCSDDDGVLEKWLRKAGAAAVVIRPDRVVLAQARPGAGYGDALARAAAPLTDLLPP